jgi:Leucine Rich repeat
MFYDNGAERLAGVIKTSPSLTRLNASGNIIGTAGAASLADALNGNCTLTSLDISGSCAALFTFVVQWVHLLF